MNFAYYALKRILLVIPTIIVVSFVLYVIMFLIYNGNPVLLYVPSLLAALELRQDPAKYAALKHKYGFDQPWYIQWWRSLIRLVQGNWGLSPLYGGQPVINVLAKTFPATLEIAIPAVILALIVGIPYGIKSSIDSSKKSLYITSSSTIGASVPTFVSALLIQAFIWEFFFFLAVKTSFNNVFNFSFYHYRYNHTYFTYPSHLIFGLPVTNFLLIDSLLSLNLPLFIDAILHILGPSFCIFLAIIPFIVRMTRTSMMSTLKQDYIFLARSKGLKERTIIYRHAFRNAIIPIASMLSYLFTATIIASIYVEVIFSYPGIGLMMFRGMQAFDMSLMQGFLILVSFLFILTNLIIDLAYFYIDPRIKTKVNEK